MMNRLQVVPTYSEQILNLPVDSEEALGLLDGSKAPHLRFLFTRMLMRDFSSVVLVQTCQVLS